MSRILLTGIATLDVINEVDHYPAEDEEMRAVAQRINAGGNACNSARVLAKLGHQSALAAVVADEPDGKRIESALQEAGVDIQYLNQQEGKSPVSYITLNQLSGSRTIVHYRDLPELAAKAFIQIPVEHFDWLHFEGRNIKELVLMMDHVRTACSDQVVSLEIEKYRKDGDVAALIPKADVVMFSKAYLNAMSEDDPIEFLQAMHVKYPRHLFTCAWGEKGAYAIDQEGEVCFVQAPQVQAVDSVGAGDVFNAGLISALASGRNLQESLAQAVELASEKVQRHGF